jgi:hypothetical protein
MSLLHRGDVLQAAHELYCVAVNNRWDDLHWKRPREWDEFVAGVPRLDDLEQLEIMWRRLGRVEQAWGHEVGLVFYHMGYRDEGTQARPLFYLFLGLMGHGISLADEYEDDLTRAGEVLLRWRGGSFGPAPFYDDIDEWFEAAETKFPKET